MIIPDTLKKGDKAILLSPSGGVDKNTILSAHTTLREWGLNVVDATNMRGSYYNFSGTITERLNDVQEAFDDISTKAIVCTRGGYGAVQYIDKVNIKAFANNPKWLIGFSDITILHSILNRNNIASLHAPMPKNYADLLASKDDRSMDLLHSFLFNNALSYSWEAQCNQNQVNVYGEIVGGNLSVLSGLRGSLYEPHYHGRILFLEDLGEYIYHIDRLLHNFKISGIFNRITALLVGAFTNIKENDTPFGMNVQELISRACEDANIPVIFNVPAGHQIPNYPIPFGRQVAISYINGKAQLSLGKT